MAGHSIASFAAECRLSRVDLSSDEQGPIIDEFIRLLKVKNTTTAKVPRSFGPDLRSWCLRPIEAYSGRFEGTLVMLPDEALQKRPHEPNSEKVPLTAEHQLLGKMAPPTRSGHDSAASSSATAGPSRIDEAHAMHVARHFADLHRRRRFTDLKVRSPHPVFGGHLGGCFLP